MEVFWKWINSKFMDCIIDIWFYFLVEFLDLMLSTFNFEIYSCRIAGT